MPVVTAIVALSPWHRDNLKSVLQTTRGDASVNELPFALLGNAIHDSAFPSSTLEALATHKIANRFLWTSDPHRGLDTLLKRWDTIRRLLPDASLVVCRGRDAFKDLPKLLEQMTASPGVTYIPGLPNRDLLLEWERADFFYYPTEFNETYCISALEAQRAGALVITHPVAALTSTVGDRGRMLDAAPNSPEYETQLSNVLCELRDSPRKKEAMREIAFNWARSQTWRERAREWDKMFRK
jgi:glycosyltransferase involved in cell wall biosynthesis